MDLGQHRLGQYELQQLVESDTLSESWKAFDTRRRRYVIVRILHFASPAATDLLPRFRRETQGLPSLHHPNIAPVLDIQTMDHEAYLVTDYVEGQSLADYIHITSHQGRFPTATEISHLLAPIGTALDYAHRQGIIHGRLKPANILFDRHEATTDLPGVPKLIGFGLHNMQAPSTLPIEDVYYISPELVQGQTENIRCDIYSLGVILYELCTGTRPFQGDTPAEVMMQHVHTTPRSPVLINPHILPATTALIMRSLAKNPLDRFPTASALVAALTRAASSSPPGRIGLSGSPPAAISAPAQPSLPAATQRPIWSGEPASVHLSQQSYVTTPGPLRTTPPPVSLPPHPVPVAHLPARRRGRGWFIALLVLLLLLVLGSAAAGALQLYPRLLTNVTAQPVGNAFFVSSGLVSENSNQGITDKVQIVLRGLPLPRSGKSYYAWLLSDGDPLSSAPPILLATLPATTEQITVSYPGDAQHSNLLAQYSRLLITEEDAASAPLNPSLESTTWRYFARLSATKASSTSFSVLDHLRHLLAQDPKLKAAGLTGGLDIWLFRNTMKILEWAGSARDAYQSGDTGLIQRQTIRILDYLDGQQYIHTENLPAGLPEVLVDPVIARVALLEFNVQAQSPPGYLKHIGTHLQDIVQAPGVTPAQKTLAIQINAAINNVQSWLVAVHKDAEQLIHMTPAQLKQPDTRTLLDHMFVQANYAFVGQTDPNTNLLKAGVAQIHYDIQRLATFDITVCTPANTATLCA